MSALLRMAEQSGIASDIAMCLAVAIVIVLLLRAVVELLDSALDLRDKWLRRR